MSETKSGGDFQQKDDNGIAKLLPEEVLEALDGADPEAREKIIAIVSSLRVAQHFEGPLPPSYMLKEYEEVQPGAADRIIGMAERQAAHRQEIEKTAIKSKSASEVLGVVFAGLIGVTSVIGGIFLIYSGFGAGGIVSILSTLATLVGAYIYGTRSERRERVEKKRQRDG